jgi:hypothetical protein
MVQIRRLSTRLLRLCAEALMKLDLIKIDSVIGEMDERDHKLGESTSSTVPVNTDDHADIALEKLVKVCTLVALKQSLQILEMIHDRAISDLFADSIRAIEQQRQHKLSHSASQSTHLPSYLPQTWTSNQLFATSQLKSSSNTSHQVEPLSSPGSSDWNAVHLNQVFTFNAILFGMRQFCTDLETLVYHSRQIVASEVASRIKNQPVSFHAEANI